MLPHALKNEVQRLATRRGVSLGELVREGLERLLADDARGRRDAFFADDAVFSAAGPRDLARDHDRYLYDE